MLVIGAGVAGLSLASELSARSTRKVVVAEREAQPGVHATGRSAAILVEGYGSPLVQRLTTLSRADLLGERPGDPRPRGILYVAAQDAASAAAPAGAAQPIPLTRAGEMVPLLATDRLRDAYYDPTAADIDVHGLMSGYVRRLRANGGELVAGAAVLGADCTAEGWTVAMGGDVVVEARVVVNAAGAWAQAIGALFGAGSISLTPHRRSAAIVTLAADVDPRAWPMVVDLDETVYFKPEGGQLMVSPADETPSPACDAYPEDLDIAIGIDRFEALSRLAVRRVTHSWAGLRTFTPDRNPVLGFDPVAPGFFWVAGQGGVGVQTAPAMARLGAELLLGMASEHQDLADGVSPARFRLAD